MASLQGQESGSQPRANPEFGPKREDKQTILTHSKEGEGERKSCHLTDINSYPNLPTYIAYELSFFFIDKYLKYKLIN